MPTVRELRETRAARVAEMQGLCANAEREKRDLAENEAQRFEALKAEVRGLEGQIGRAETLAEMDRHADATPVGGRGGEGQLEARFSLGRAIADTLSGRGLQGAEREWNAEHRSQRTNAFTCPTGILMPASGDTERRAILTTTPAAGHGGNLIGTVTSQQVIDRLRPALKVQAMGATVLTGLTQNLELPRLKSSGTVAYVGEHQEGPTADPAFDAVGLTPRTITGNYEMSRRMMLQAPQLEQILRTDLSYLLGQQLDLASISGLGGAVYPSGIMVTPGTKQVNFDKTGANAAQNWINFTAAMIAAPEEAEVSGTAGFLANTFTKALLNTFLMTTGEPLGWQSFFNQERVEWSNQIANNIGAGPYTSAMVYSGNWADLIIGYFSSVDIVLNPYADAVAKKGGAFLHAFLDHDIALRHPEAFSWSKNVPNTVAASSTQPA